MAHKMALMLALVAAALLHTVRTETTAPDTQDNHSNNGEFNYILYNSKHGIKRFFFTC